MTTFPLSTLMSLSEDVEKSRIDPDHTKEPRLRNHRTNARLMKSLGGRFTRILQATHRQNWNSKRKQQSEWLPLFSFAMRSEKCKPQRSPTYMLFLWPVESFRKRSSSPCSNKMVEATVFTNALKTGFRFRECNTF